MDGMFKVFAAVIVVLAVSSLIYAALSKITKAKERKAYEAMIMNPSDAAVQAYIPVFLSSQHNFKIEIGGGNGGTTTYINSQQELAEIKARQAHGYQIIAKSDKVSQPVKEQLRRVYLSKGVPVQ